MNYIRDIINYDNYDNADDIFGQLLEDTINTSCDNIFQQLIENINEIPFNTTYENTPEYMINQRIINNAYLLRRNIELSHDEQTYVSRSHSTLLHSQHTLDNLSQPSIPESILAYFNFMSDTTNLSSDSLDSHMNVPYLLDSLHSNTNHFITEDFNYLEDVKIILSADEFNKLAKVTDETLIVNKQCNICLEELQKNDLSNNSLIQLQCNHIFHNICIREWLTKQSSKCPSCRFCCKL